MDLVLSFQQSHPQVVEVVGHNREHLQVKQEDLEVVGHKQQVEPLLEGLGTLQPHLLKVVMAHLHLPDKEIMGEPQQLPVLLGKDLVGVVHLPPVVTVVLLVLAMEVMAQLQPFLA
jgi:hypothetical protein